MHTKDFSGISCIRRVLNQHHLPVCLEVRVSVNTVRAWVKQGNHNIRRKRVVECLFSIQETLSITSNRVHGGGGGVKRHLAVGIATATLKLRPDMSASHPSAMIRRP